jgi:hypothetical protein
MQIVEGLRLKGKIKIDVYRGGFVEAAELYLTPLKEYRRLLSHRPTADSGRWLRETIAHLTERLDALRADHFIRTAVECPNLIMGSANYGLDIIIQRLVGMNTYSLNILYGEVGTGTTMPALTDTGLTTPTNRAAVGFQQDYGSTDAVLQFFYSDSQLANTTYTEFGTFIDGTTTISSGQLFNHSLLSPSYVKAAGTDTTFQLDVEVANS